MSYDKGLAARMADCLAAIGERRIRQKNVFGGRGFLVAKSTFAIAWDDGVIVKTPREEYQTAQRSWESHPSRLMARSR